MKQKLFSNSELQSIRGLLPRGALKSLSEEFHVSYGTVLNCFSGKSSRYDILVRAADIARQTKSIREELKDFTNETRKEERLPSPINC
jgi:hypothetical protein